MPEWVPVGELVPGDWITDLGSRKFMNREAQVVEVKRGFTFNGIGEWGVVTDEGTGEWHSHYLHGPDGGVLARRATIEEKLLLDAQLNTIVADRARERHQRRSLRQGTHDDVIESVLRRLTRRAR